MDVFYLIRYLHLETENQRAKLLPMLSELGEKIMRYHLDRYRRTEKWRMRPNQNLQHVGPKGQREVKQYHGFGSFFQISVTPWPIVRIACSRCFPNCGAKF
ncbi:hypothetical protein M405DRAFT_433193 [Rhizopogon salebrosus TDB-379]|nr:hypothetical protein M405DRAFT_433193 [Rhizopogon salebrosus TDB-379]